jgi:hypothetical protein
MKLTVASNARSLSEGVRHQQRRDGILKRTTEFATLTGLVVLTRVCDGITTYLVTPDLTRELNPLAAGGWLTMIGAATLVLALSTWLHYLHLFRPLDNFPSSTGYTLRQFKAHYLNPKENALVAKTPGRVLAHLFGYIMPRTLVLWSVLLILNNFATLMEFAPYVELKRSYPVWVLFYAALPLIALLLFERLQRHDFGRYQALSGSTSGPRTRDVSHEG